MDNRLDGPPLVALWGDDMPERLYRLGTRSYDWHAHVRGQIFCVESGLIHVRTRHGSWLLPPHRAGWMPPGEAHQVNVLGAMSGWTVLLTPDVARPLPSFPQVIGISELMRALVRRAVAWSDQSALTVDQERIVAVLIDEILRAGREPLHLPMPTDPRLLRISRAILEDPRKNWTVEEWARFGGLSVRTLSRLFRNQTAMSFARWSQQARLTLAMEMLAQGEPVAVIADAVGYASPSNFIAMFRRHFGTSPGRYFSTQAD